MPQDGADGDQVPARNAQFKSKSAKFDVIYGEKRAHHMRCMGPGNDVKECVSYTIGHKIPSAAQFAPGEGLSDQEEGSQQATCAPIPVEQSAAVVAQEAPGGIDGDAADNKGCRVPPEDTGN